VVLLKGKLPGEFIYKALNEKRIRKSIQEIADPKISLNKVGQLQKLKYRTA
jgi:hypothetical protein